MILIMLQLLLNNDTANSKHSNTTNNSNANNDNNDKFTRKGTTGVSTNGVTANLMFFDRGTFWVLPLMYFYLPKSARAYLFPQPICQIRYSCIWRPH